MYERSSKLNKDFMEASLLLVSFGEVGTKRSGKERHAARFERLYSSETGASRSSERDRLEKAAIYPQLHDIFGC